MGCLRLVELDAENRVKFKVTTSHTGGRGHTTTNSTRITSPRQKSSSTQASSAQSRHLHTLRLLLPACLAALVLSRSMLVMLPALLFCGGVHLQLRTASTTLLGSCISWGTLTCWNHKSSILLRCKELTFCRALAPITAKCISRKPHLASFRSQT